MHIPNGFRIPPKFRKNGHLYKNLMHLASKYKQMDTIGTHLVKFSNKTPIRPFCFRNFRIQLEFPEFIFFRYYFILHFTTTLEKQCFFKSFGELQGTIKRNLDRKSTILRHWALVGRVPPSISFRNRVCSTYIE